MKTEREQIIDLAQDLMREAAMWRDRNEPDVANDIAESAQAALRYALTMKDEPIVITEEDIPF